jgi:ATP-binding cassette, subfamily C, bacterial CydD
LSVHARGRCVVVATHSPAVMAWADRVVTLPAPVQLEGGR